MTRYTTVKPMFTLHGSFVSKLRGAEAFMASTVGGNEKI